MKRLAMAVAIGMSLAACGSSSNGSITSPGAAAAAKTFTYSNGTSGDFTSSSAALTAQLGGLVAPGSLSAGSAEAASDFTATTSALLGGYTTPIGLAGAQGQSALTLAGGRITQVVGVDSTSAFDNPGCVKEGADRVDFDGCTVSRSDSTGSGKATLNGHFQASATAADWSLTLDLALSGSANGQSGSIDLHYGTSGNVSSSTAGNLVTAKGDLREELAMDWNVNGQSGGFDVSEQLLFLDPGITYDTSADCVVSGTLEAKRVWVKKPSDHPELTDKAAKVTWQSCGNGSVLLSD